MSLYGSKFLDESTLNLSFPVIHFFEFVKALGVHIQNGVDNIVTRKASFVMNFYVCHRFADDLCLLSLDAFCTAEPAILT